MADFKRGGNYSHVCSCGESANLTGNSLLKKAPQPKQVRKLRQKPRQLMQTAPLLYLAPPGRHAIIDALAPIVQSWFADTVSEPIPEELVAIIRRIDVQSFADDRQAVHRKDVVANALA